MSRVPFPTQEDAAEPRGRGRPVSAEKHEAIVEAAIEEFACMGFDGASMDAIAARAGVAKRTLYNRYQSKDGLFDMLVDELARRIVGTSALNYCADVPLRDQLLAYARDNQRFMIQQANVQLLRAVLGEHIRHPQRVAPLLQRHWVNEYGFVDWMKAAIADQRLEGEPGVLAHLLGGLMKASFLWPNLLGRGDSANPSTYELLVEGVEMFLARYERGSASAETRNGRVRRSLRSSGLPGKRAAPGSV